MTWNRNGLGNWYKYNGAGGWTQQADAPVIFTRSPGGSTITTTSGVSLTDAAGNVWAFGSAVNPGSGNAVLMNGIQVAGSWGRLLEMDWTGLTWLQNSAGLWYKYNGAGGWTQQTAGPASFTELPAGSTITALGGGSLIDFSGNVWSFGSQVSPPYGNAVLLNGKQASGAWGVKLEIDLTGISWRQDGVGAWYKYNGAGGWQQAKAPVIFAASGSGASIFASAGVMTQLRLVNAGKWASPAANANIVPTIANGKVYVASFDTLTIWGLTK